MARGCTVLSTKTGKRSVKSFPCSTPTSSIPGPLHGVGAATGKGRKAALRRKGRSPQGQGRGPLSGEPGTWAGTSSCLGDSQIIGDWVYAQKMTPSKSFSYSM